MLSATQRNALTHATNKSSVDNQGNVPVTESAFIERIMCGTTIIAIIVSGEFREPGIHFVTPGEYSQQLAFMRHPAGKSIEPHVHNSISREVCYTQEVLLLRKGKLRVDFYDNDQRYLESRILIAGDVILLIEGGHGFKVLEGIEMVEVKQGPYLQDRDKTRFPGIDDNQVELRFRGNK
jgi:hypothetical protein